MVFSLVGAACGASDPESTPTSLADPASVTVTTGETVETGATEPATTRALAPEFPTDLEWLNTERPLSLEQLNGKVVVLDFWTYGCINCIHILPDLERLEQEYAEELVVIGVHSAKFDQESATDNIRQIILRYGIEHPVVNDLDFEVWRSFGASAWPTVFVLDPGGGVVGWHAGEGVYDVVRPVIEDLLVEFDGAIDRTPLDLKLERQGLPETLLSFPGKVTADPGRRLFISDTNHHRIVQTDLDGVVQAVYGSGAAGFADGPATEATFDQPQGTVVSADGSTLYVADTENHAIRAVDLATGDVTTVAGTGAQGWPPSVGQGLETDLNSPWDLEIDDERLYIAMAGTHQIWSLGLVSGFVGPYAGSAREGVANGAGSVAELAQPSGLSLAIDGRLFFADSESSSIRWVDTRTDERVVGIAAGTDADLFTFGDRDGIGTEALFQHPLGVASVGNLVYVADTYNSKIKTIDLGSGAVTSRWGGGSGWRDGSSPLFYEPGGISELGGRLYVADTNNHSVRVIDLATGDVSTLVLSGIEAYLPAAGTEAYRGTIIELAPIEVAAGPGEVVLDVRIPEGYKVNPDAPSSFIWTVAGTETVLAPDASGTRINPSFPLTFGATFGGTESTLTGDLSIVYCDVDAESICLIEQVRVSVPLQIGGGASTVAIEHVIELPEL